MSTARFMTPTLVLLLGGCLGGEPDGGFADGGPVDGGRADAGSLVDGGVQDAGALDDFIWPVGDCDLLLDPLSVDEREAATELLTALDPAWMLNAVGVGDGASWLWDAVDDCGVTVSGNLGTTHRVDTPGCETEAGVIVAGTASSSGQLGRTRSFSAELLDVRMPEGLFPARRVRLHGAFERNISGYGVGNPPFGLTTDLWLRVDGANPDDMEVLGSGGLYLGLDKWFDTAATGYVSFRDLHGLDGDGCVTAIYDGLNLADVSFP
jgi:hypothetical protein